MAERVGTPSKATREESARARAGKGEKRCLGQPQSTIHAAQERVSQHDEAASNGGSYDVGECEVTWLPVAT